MPSPHLQRLSSPTSIKIKGLLRSPRPSKFVWALKLPTPDKLRFFLKVAVLSKIHDDRPEISSNNKYTKICPSLDVFTPVTFVFSTFALHVTGQVGLVGKIMNW